jgi:chromosomal replication initiation ATPase DnaA
MRLAKEDGCDFASKGEKATSELLARLIEHHDYSVPFQHVTKAQVIEIKAAPEVAIPIEIGILPVPCGKLTVDAIKRVVCLHFKISHSAMISPRREPNIVRPRMVAMYLIRDLTDKSFQEIGRAFGNRDHTTVMHAVNTILRLMEVGDEITVDVEYLREVLEA